MTDQPYRAKVTRSATSYSIAIRSASPFSGGMTVGDLRDFARALDAAGIPDEAELRADRNPDTMHFTNLRVHHTVTVAQAETDEAAQR